MRRICVIVGLASAVQSSAAPCWHSAAQRYGIDAGLLEAIARTESNLNAVAVNRSHAPRTGSHDIGLMQINSRHLPKLAGFGIRETDLYDACVNLHVGAWLLADSFARHGFNWTAVGAYNAACTRLQGEDCTRARSRYAWKVYRHLPRQRPGAATAPDFCADAAVPAPRSRSPAENARETTTARTRCHNAGPVASTQAHGRPLQVLLRVTPRQAQPP